MRKRPIAWWSPLTGEFYRDRKSTPARPCPKHQRDVPLYDHPYTGKPTFNVERMVRGKWQWASSHPTRPKAESMAQTVADLLRCDTRVVPVWPRSESVDSTARVPDEHRIREHYPM